MAAAWRRLYEEVEERSHPFDGFNGVKSSNLEGIERLDRLYGENEGSSPKCGVNCSSSIINQAASINDC